MTIRKNVFAATLWALVIIGMLAAPAAEHLEEAFRNPPKQARIRAYAWHWLQGQITKEGITADLENMAKAGFTGAVIYSTVKSFQSQIRPYGLVCSFSSAMFSVVISSTMSRIFL